MTSEPQAEYTRFRAELRHYFWLKFGTIIGRILPDDDLADFDRVRFFEELLDAYESDAEISIIYPAADVQPLFPPAQLALTTGPQPDSKPEVKDMPEADDTSVPAADATTDLEQKPPAELEVRPDPSAPVPATPSDTQTGTKSTDESEEKQEESSILDRFRHVSDEDEPLDQLGKQFAKAGRLIKRAARYVLFFVLGDKDAR
jgi:hypothetical protein